MTLWDFEKVMRHSLSITLADLRRHIPNQASAGLTVDMMIEIRNSVADELKGRVINLEDIRFHAFKRTLESIGCYNDTLAAHLNTLYLKHRFEDIELYPDVMPVLDILRSDFTIGLLSNGNGYPEKCGLPDRFSFVVFSQDVGVEKPHSGMFRAACRHAGCDPCELIHIGDSLGSDVAGANGVGAISVWLNRDNELNETGIVPDYEIQSLFELTEVLKKTPEITR